MSGSPRTVAHEEPGLSLHQGLHEQMKQRRQAFLRGSVSAQKQERPGDHGTVEEVEATQVVDETAVRLGQQCHDHDPVRPGART
jgi:hypothetical protein